MRRGSTQARGPALSRAEEAGGRGSGGGRKAAGGGGRSRGKGKTQAAWGDHGAERGRQRDRQGNTETLRGPGRASADGARDGGGSPSPLGSGGVGGGKAERQDGVLGVAGAAMGAVAHEMDTEPDSLQGASTWGSRRTADMQPRSWMPSGDRRCTGRRPNQRERERQSNRQRGGWTLLHFSLDLMEKHSLEEYRERCACLKSGLRFGPARRHSTRGSGGTPRSVPQGEEVSPQAESFRSAQQQGQQHHGKESALQRPQSAHYADSYLHSRFLLLAKLSSPLLGWVPSRQWSSLPVEQQGQEGGRWRLA